MEALRAELEDRSSAISSKPIARPRALQPVRSLALGSLQKRIVLGVVAATWLSGAVWLYFQFVAAPVAGEFGPEPHPAQAVSLKVHGAAAMLWLVALGALIPVHVRAGLAQGRRRPSGVSVLAISILLGVSGWALYYVGHEAVRAGTSLVHSAVGLLLPVLLVGHGRLLTRKPSA